MNISYSAQRVAVLIDTANLYHTTKHVYHTRAAFAPIIERALCGRTAVRVIAYTINTETAEEKPFIESLENIGIEIKSKELITYKNGDTKGDWDVGIAVDALNLASHIDVLVLISGDGDFAPLVKQLQSTGVRVEAVGFEQSMSQLLLDVVDCVVNLSIDAHNYLIHSNYKLPPMGKARPMLNVKHKTPADAVLAEIDENIPNVKLPQRQIPKPISVSIQPIPKPIPAPRVPALIPQKPVAQNTPPVQVLQRATVKPPSPGPTVPRKPQIQQNNRLLRTDMLTYIGVDSDQVVKPPVITAGETEKIPAKKKRRYYPKKVG
jgi:uncharacterized LabA/DUF88 family protein